MERMTPHQILSEIKKLRSLSYACISQDQGQSIDRAIVELEAKFDEMGWEWVVKKEGGIN